MTKREERLKMKYSMAKQAQVKGCDALLALEKERAVEERDISDYEFAFALGKTEKEFHELSPEEIEEIGAWGTAFRMCWDDIKKYWHVLLKNNKEKLEKCI